MSDISHSYEVTVEEIIHHTIRVDAVDAEQAAAIAVDVLPTAEPIESHVVERQAVSTTLISGGGDA